MSFSCGDIVLTAHPRTAAIVTMPVLAGNVVAVDDANQSCWLDLNNLGVHLPQLYWQDELILATPASVAPHDLCVQCLGYGIASGGEECSSCVGSGSSQYRLQDRHRAVVEQYKDT